MAGIDNDIRTYQDAYASGTQIPLSPSLVQLLALQRNEAAKRAGANQQQLQQQPMPGTILQQKQQAQYAQQSPQDLAQRIGPTMQRQAEQQQQMQQAPQQAPQGLASLQQPQQFNDGGQVSNSRRGYLEGQVAQEARDAKAIADMAAMDGSQDGRQVDNQARSDLNEKAAEAVRNAKARGKSLDETLADIDKLMAGLGGGSNASTDRTLGIKQAIQQAWGPEEAGMPEDSIEAMLGADAPPRSGPAGPSFATPEAMFAETVGAQQQVEPQQTAPEEVMQQQAQPSFAMPEAMFAETVGAQPPVDPQQTEIDALLGSGAQAQPPATPDANVGQGTVLADAPQPYDLEGMMAGLLGDSGQQKPQDVATQVQPTSPEAMVAETAGAQQAQTTNTTPDAFTGEGNQLPTTLKNQPRPKIGGNPFSANFATPEQMASIRAAGYQGNRETLSLRELDREKAKLGIPVDATPDGFTGAATKAPATGIDTIKKEVPAVAQTQNETEDDIEAQLAQVLGGGPQSLALRAESVESAENTEFDGVMPTSEFTTLAESAEGAKALKEVMGMPEKSTDKEMRVAQEEARKLYMGELGNTETRKMLVSAMGNVQRIYDRAAARNDNRWNHISSFLRGMSGGTTLSSGLAMGSASMANNIDRLSSAEARAAKDLFGATKELYASDMRIAEGAFNYADTVLKRMEAENQAIDQTDSARTNQVIQLNAQQDNTRNTEAWNKYTAEREIWAANLKHTTDMAIASMKNQGDALTNYVTNAAKLADLTKLSVETQDLIMERLPTIVSRELIKAAKSDDPATAAAAQQKIATEIKTEMDKTGLPQSMQTIAILQKMLGGQLGGLPEEQAETQVFTEKENAEADNILGKVMNMFKE